MQTENKMCRLHEMRLDKIEKEIDKIIKDIKEIKEKVNSHDLRNARNQEMMSNFDKRFTQLENCLKSVAAELKSVSNSLADVSVRSKLGDEKLNDKLEGSLKGHIANNKELYAIITTLITLLSYVIKNWG